MLLANRTAGHQAFFEEGKEADYFDSSDELVDKMHFYKRRKNARFRITEAGRKRFEKGWYAYLERMLKASGEMEKYRALDTSPNF